MAKIPDLSDFAIAASNFKCFGATPSGYPEFKLINVIVGRNNSGKSALVDLVSIATGKSFKDIPTELRRSSVVPVFHLSSRITEAAAKKVFPEGRSGGRPPLNIFGSHWDFGRQLVSRPINWTRSGTDGSVISATAGWPDECRRHSVNLAPFAALLAEAMPNPLAGKRFRRLAAERNVAPEADADLFEDSRLKDDSRLKVDVHGTGCTNIIKDYLNQSSLDATLIEKTLTSAMNEIFSPDLKFMRLRCQQLSKGGPWEVFLEEEGKGRIPLSQSGSGIKTVILVLLHLLVIPVAEGHRLRDYVFAFEELENNLHPSLLRRLLIYIENMASKEGFVTILTTHSSAVIDMFSRTPDAQILHVRHDGNSSTVSVVSTYVDNKGVLDDLDVRASDLLQANCVVWVEGPSDRVYLNHWISLWSERRLREGTHYQCVFYGGRLLAHLEAQPDSDVDSGVQILRVSRHAVVVIDSDKRCESASVNKTKSRIQSEIEQIGGLSWITAGREIENYIPIEAIANWKAWQIEEQRDQFADFFELLDAKEAGLGKKYQAKKPLLAEQLLPHIKLEASKEVLDLDERMTALCRFIRKANGIEG